MMRTNKMSRRAFTLIELLVVIVVIAVLAAIIIPKFASQGKRSKEAALKSNMSMVRTALASCQADTGLWPATLADLTGAVTPTANGYNSGGTTTTWPTGAWHGPYADSGAFTDPDYRNSADLHGGVRHAGSSHDPDRQRYRRRRVQHVLKSGKRDLPRRRKSEAQTDEEIFRFRFRFGPTQ